MAAPRLEIDLNKIHYNAQALVARLAKQSISIMGVTKAALGSIEIANTLLEAGIAELGDSRIENIKTMRLCAGNSLINKTSMTLVRSPMLSQLAQVVEYADISFNTEIAVIKNYHLKLRNRGASIKFY